MKTLVIHPFDRTTDFLRPIYIDIPNVKIMRNINTIKSEYINEFDRIIMLGHGCEMGLFNPRNYSLIIDDDFVEVLRNKICIAIWCNADVFMEDNNLNGIYTGMMISDLDEAKRYLSESEFQELSKKDMDDSNSQFATAMKYIVSKYGSSIMNESNNTIDEFRLDIDKNYPKKTPLLTFNNERIFNNYLQS